MAGHTYAEVRRYSPDEIATLIAGLVQESGMALADLRTKGHDFQLDSRQRGILAEIEGLEWLRSR